MAVDPADRPASASAFVDRLATAVAAPDARGGVPTVPLPEPPGSPRRPRLGSDPPGGRSWQRSPQASCAHRRSDDDGAPATDPAKVATSFPVPRGPVSVAAGADLVWVASRNADRITAYARDGSRARR